MRADQPLVITGATGFVGKHLLRLLVRDGIENVTLLLNKSSGINNRLPGWATYTGGLSGAALPALPEGCVILHLAAATGKASPAEMQRVNVAGTALLLDAARKAEASHVVFVSSIAAGFADRRWYPYAESKRRAEELVLASGLRSTILRPTMIFGAGSAVQKGLTTLATAPWPIVFGRGNVRVQPVSVDDVAQVLHSFALQPPSIFGDNMPISVGGPEQLTMLDLMQRLRRRRGGSERGAIHIPVNLTRRFLAILEPALRPVMPLTAGQLASFANDSIAAAHPLIGERLPTPTALEEMLANR